MNPLFIHMHILASYPNALTQRNRDGEQKRLHWAGSDRPYFSSALIKRIGRQFFETSGTVPEEMRAVRTRQHQLVAQKLVDQHSWPNDLADEATRAMWVKLTGGKGDKDADGGLAFLRSDALDLMLNTMVEHRELMELLARVEFPPRKPGKDASKEEKEQYKEDTEKHNLAKEALKDSGHIATLDAICEELLSAKGNVSIAMFGRMLAAHPRHDVTAALRVAHAMGLDAWHDSNTDFFSAVDDLSENGSAYIQPIDLGSSSYYRYSVLDVQQFCSNLGKKAPDEDVATWINATLQGLVTVLPVSKQSATASTSWPLFVGLDFSPYSLGSLVNAFVRPTGNTYELDAHQLSAQTLLDRLARDNQVYRPGASPMQYVTVLDGLEPHGAEPIDSLQTLLKNTRTRVLAA